MLICRSCGTDNVEGAVYCAKCGATLPSPAMAPVVSQGQVASVYRTPPRMTSLAIVGLMLGLLGVIIVLNELLESYQYAGYSSSASYMAWAFGFLLTVFATIYEIFAK